MKGTRDLVIAGCAMAWMAGSAWWVARSNARVTEELGRLQNELRAEQARVVTSEARPSGIDAATLRAELSRALSRLPVAQAVDGQPNSTQPQAAPEATPKALSPSPEPQSVEAFDQATRHIDEAIARKVWTDEDQRKLRELARGLDGQTRHDLMASVSRAINEGRLTLSGTHF